MLLSIQFPFADTRAFLEEDVGLLGIPNWPQAIADVDFVRCFGIVRERPLRVPTAWVGENPICKAHRALRFAKAPVCKTSIDKITIPLRIAYRHFYFDGLATGKFEVGLASQCFRYRTLTRRAAREMFYQILRFPVKIPNFWEKLTEVPLWRAGKPLAQLYANSSVLSSHISKQQERSVCSFTPTLVLIEEEQDKDIPAPFSGQLISTMPFLNDNFSASHHTINIDGAIINLWVIREYKFSTFSSVRALRTCLLRLSSEYACLSYILRSIGTMDIVVKPRSKASQILQLYLDHAINVILRKESRIEEFTYGIEFVEAARELIEFSNPGEHYALVTAFRKAEIQLEQFDLRPNIKRKAKSFIEKMIVAHNYYGSIAMENQYNSYGQTGSMGPNSTGIINNYNQSWQQICHTIDLPRLDEELSTLRSKLRERAETPEEDKAIAAIADAQIEAKKGNGSKVLEYLAKAGNWTLDVAKEIGVKVASEALKQAISING
jgi:hypothetical protein